MRTKLLRSSQFNLRAAQQNLIYDIDAHNSFSSKFQLNYLGYINCASVSCPQKYCAAQIETEELRSRFQSTRATR